MVGKLDTWPRWPEFTLESGEPGEDLVNIKAAILTEYGAENLQKSWIKVCQKLEGITKEIEDKGSAIIPAVQFKDLSSLTHEQKQHLQDVGCFLVRGVIEKEQAEGWFHNLKEYISDNQSNVVGWPKETPAILNLYYSPTQIAARSHPNSLEVAQKLIDLWHEEGPQAPLNPLSYADAVRIRPPGQPFFGLGPHIDAGSLSRWADPTYRACYAAVWEGHPEDLDMYDLSSRKHANTRMFPGAAHCGTFRAFQGWTSLTTTGPGEGSLLLYPHVKWAIAYVLLRPFFKAPDNPSNVMDPTKWTLDPDTPWFPGTNRADSQMLSLGSHPHLRLRDCLVHIPQMTPGDTVWWHADMCHAVDTEHNGQGDSSVLYIAATPSTDNNVQYIQRQLKDFQEGRLPPDFQAPDRLNSKEPSFQGYVGESGIISAEGKKAMGIRA